MKWLRLHTATHIFGSPSEVLYPPAKAPGIHVTWSLGAPEYGVTPQQMPWHPCDWGSWGPQMRFSSPSNGPGTHVTWSHCTIPCADACADPTPCATVHQGLSLSYHSNSFLHPVPPLSSLPGLPHAALSPPLPSSPSCSAFAHIVGSAVSLLSHLPLHGQHVHVMWVLLHAIWVLIGVREPIHLWCTGGAGQKHCSHCTALYCPAGHQPCPPPPWPPGLRVRLSECTSIWGSTVQAVWVPMGVH